MPGACAASQTIAQGETDRRIPRWPHDRPVKFHKTNPRRTQLRRLAARQEIRLLHPHTTIVGHHQSGRYDRIVVSLSVARRVLRPRMPTPGHAGAPHLPLRHLDIRIHLKRTAHVGLNSHTLCPHGCCGYKHRDDKREPSEGTQTELHDLFFYLPTKLAETFQ